MAAYEYTALESNGKRARGVINADSVRSARKELRVRQLTPISVEPTRGEGKSNNLSFSDRLSSKDRALMTRQLAMLISSQMPVEQALAAAASEGSKPVIRKLLLSIRSDVMEGVKFADALAKSPKAFPPLYQAVASAGEQSGRLGSVMESLADYLENAYRVRQKVQSALIYPILLCVMALGMVGALMVFVVPRLLEQFSVFDAKLPPLTQFVIGTSNFLQAWGVFLLVGSIAASIGVNRMLTLPPIRAAADRILLKLPLLGEMQRNVMAARFARIFATLSSSGATVLESLSAARGAMTNTVFRQAAGDIADSVREGGSLSGAMKKTGVFPAMMLHMVTSGEAARDVPVMMNRAAEFLEREFETATDVSLSLLEPLIIIVLGGIVGTIVLSIMLPIMQLNTLALG